MNPKWAAVNSSLLLTADKYASIGALNTGPWININKKRILTLVTDAPPPNLSKGEIFKNLDAILVTWFPYCRRLASCDGIDQSSAAKQLNIRFNSPTRLNSFANHRLFLRFLC